MVATADATGEAVAIVGPRSQPEFVTVVFTVTARGRVVTVDPVAVEAVEAAVDLVDRTVVAVEDLAHALSPRLYPVDAGS